MEKMEKMEDLNVIEVTLEGSEKPSLVKRILKPAIVILALAAGAAATYYMVSNDKDDEKEDDDDNVEFIDF